MNARDPIRLHGLFLDMPAADYFMSRGFSNSAMSQLARSPWHYKNQVAKEATAAMKAGTLAHTAILEPEAMATRYVVKPEGLDGRTKDGRAWLAALPGGVDVISEEQAATARGQADAVHAVPELCSALSKGYAESSVFWTDEATGIHCKARPDWVYPLEDGRVMLLDLKTTADESPQAFARSVVNFGYHRQAAHYTSGFEAATGTSVAAFVFMVVSNAAPFLAVPYMLDDQAAALGRESRRELMQLLADCRERNEWPAYGSGVQLLTLPAWAR
jgi:exodeoxyribonuclease VIII